MRKFVFVLFGLMLVCSVSAWGEELTEQPAPERPLSPKMQEITEVLAAGKTQVMELQEQLKTAPNETEALRLLKAIAQQKQDTEIAMLRIQERHARLAGQSEVADQIIAAIDKILNPDPMTPDAAAMAERDAIRRSVNQAEATGGTGHE